jgi:propanol-preferring alcohol dehydrogenase/NAD+-dependent secondary alcohol dehydrogenase Adh1
MRAAQVVEYHEPVRIVEVADPVLTDPFDVLIRVAGAGICRTDLHILDGQLEAAFAPKLPYTLGHENAGWVHEVGPAVTTFAPGDPVIVHPAITCGFCTPCRSGADMHCTSWRFPGVDGWNGGYAELLRTSARSLVRLAGGTDPTRLAPHADAGLTAIHAVKRLAPFTHPGSTVVVIGFGGLGHLAVQLLRIFTTARIVVVDTSPERVHWASLFGVDSAHESGSDGGVGAVLDETDGLGADAVLDLVGEHDVPQQAMRMLRKGGVYSIVGYGGSVRLEHLDMINRELTVLGNQIGSHRDLIDLMELDRQGRIRLESACFPLDSVADVLADVAAGRILGRAVLVP